MKLDDLGIDAARLIVRTGAMVIGVGVYALTDRLLGLDLAWTILAIIVAEVLWWGSDFVWDLGTLRIRQETQRIWEERITAEMIERLHVEADEWPTSPDSAQEPDFVATAAR